jgi:hypothetical protein
MASLFFRSRWARLLASLLVVAGLLLVMPERPALELRGALAARAQDALPGGQEEEPATHITRKQKRNLLRQNFEKMKQDADELATLAKALQEELAKSNENVLSLQVVGKAEKIEKLAKRIKSTARGF